MALLIKISCYRCRCTPRRLLSSPAIEIFCQDVVLTPCSLGVRALFLVCRGLGNVSQFREQWGESEYNCIRMSDIDCRQIVARGPTARLLLSIRT